MTDELFYGGQAGGGMTQALSLEQILQALDNLPPKKQKEVVDQAMLVTKSKSWIPNPGPQTDGYYCQADELFYGGQAGGGKTDLGIGLALEEHTRSLLLRRTNKEALGLVDRIQDILGSRDGYNGQDNVWRLQGDRSIDIGGCQLEADKQKYKGDPHDLIFFDEVSDFTESQYIFITTWNRSANTKQRCRVVAAGNPPTTAEGLWVVRRWAAWLDPRHHRPALPGELRWYTTGEDGKEMEVDGPGPFLIKGEYIRARSRTFIPAQLQDNPDLASTNYGAVLAALPEELRQAYKEGRFDTVLKDQAYQVIPTEWIIQAQNRWKPRPPPGVPMCAIGVDPAQGGNDVFVLAPRYDGWFMPLIRKPGKEVPTGDEGAALIFSTIKDQADIVIDMGGGYGSVPYIRLKDNGITNVHAYKGSEESHKRTIDGKLAFYNKRSEVYWRFREALDPAQVHGSPIMLPSDPAIVADLSAPTFTIVSGRIKITPKEELIKKLGRSPDDGDAVVLSWSAGPRALTDALFWGKDQVNLGTRSGSRKGRPEVVVGHQAAKRNASYGRRR